MTFLLQIKYIIAIIGVILTVLFLGNFGTLPFLQALRFQIDFLSYYYIYYTAVYQTNLVNFTVLLLAVAVNEQLKVENRYLDSCIVKARRWRGVAGRRMAELESFMRSHTLLGVRLRRACALQSQLIDAILACELAFSVYVLTLLTFKELSASGRRVLIAVLGLLFAVLLGVAPILQTNALFYYCRRPVQGVQAILGGATGSRTLRFKFRLKAFIEMVNVEKRFFYKLLVGGDFHQAGVLQVSAR